MLFNLAPPLVMGHFVMSMLLLADATVLFHRAGMPDGLAAVVPLVGDEVRSMGRLLIVAASLVVFLGTVVTATGPHPGSHGDELVDRLPFSLHRVAQLHGISVMLFLAMVVATIVMMIRAGVPAVVLRRAELLLVVIVAQAAVGYTQYFTGVPVGLVAVHIAGAVGVWIATLWLVLGLTERVSAETPTDLLAAASP